MFTVTLIPVDVLKPHPKNKEIPPIDENIRKEMLEDIRKNGIATPLIVAKDYTILAGHQRWEIAKELGMAYVPAIVRQDIDSGSPEAVALLIKDNLLRRHYDEMTLAKQIREWKKLVGVKRGRPKEINVNYGNEKHATAYYLAFLSPDEQKQLLKVLGKSGISDLSVAGAKELRRELEESHKREEELLQRLAEVERKFAEVAGGVAEKESLQAELDALRAELAVLKENPVERVVEKVVYCNDPVLEAELEVARKQNSQLLKEKEWAEARLQAIIQEKEKKEARLSFLEEEMERLQRHLDHARKKLEEEMSRPKPPQWSKEHMEFQGLLQEATRNAASLATAIMQILEKHHERLLAAARVHGTPSADTREMAEVMGDTLLFRGFEASLNTVVSAIADVWGLLEPGKPRLEVIKGKSAQKRGERL